MRLKKKILYFLLMNRFQFLHDPILLLCIFFFFVDADTATAILEMMNKILSCIRWMMKLKDEKKKKNFKNVKKKN